MALYFLFLALSFFLFTLEQASGRTVICTHMYIINTPHDGTCPCGMLPDVGDWLSLYAQMTPCGSLLGKTTRRLDYS